MGAGVGSFLLVAIAGGHFECRVLFRSSLGWVAYMAEGVV